MTVSVKVKCFNGQAYDLSLDVLSETVADFQQKISDASGITPERQTILFKGQVLDGDKKLSEYAFSDGATISVVRRVGKAPAPAPRSEPSVGKPSSSIAAGSAEKQESSSADESKRDASNTGVPSLEEMMRSLGMGAGPGTGAATLGGGVAGGAGGGLGGLGGMAGLNALFGDPSSGAGQPSLDSFLSQLPMTVNGFLNNPLFQEYLQNPEKQKASREAILNSPALKGLLESDPEFAKVINDPEKWQASMDAARSLFNVPGGKTTSAAAGASSKEGDTEKSRELGSNPAAGSASKRPSAADLAPSGIDIYKLSESYGHALGQSLINSGLGLDPELVVKGLRSAVEGKSFPMSLPEYERSMAQLQTIASDFLTKVNLEDANGLFKEIAQDPEAVIIEEGKIAYERVDLDVPSDENLPEAKENATVLVIVTARLLDGRHFFTCPAADETGESVHPLTLPLGTAPPALAKGIVGMREMESRLLYVHPSACDGMAEMFGDLLPPNALLIFDLQLVSANAPEEDTTAGDIMSNMSSTTIASQ